MKKIIMTGKNSYIGTSFKKWISQYPESYKIQSMNVRDNQWKALSFNGYDVILHTAAVVHVKENNYENYYKVNRDLTIDIAKKAKSEGVKQFVFLSTMGVYGDETERINEETIPKPKSHYAKSKYEAEKLLLELQALDFQVSILRPPIIYGRNCPGNYTRLSKLAKKLPIFPNYQNERSMLFIDNLSEFIRIVIDNKFSGIFYPQNKDYVNVSQLVGDIAKVNGKQIQLTRIFNWLIYILIYISPMFRKVFGSFTYDKRMQSSKISLDLYQTVSFEESISTTELDNR